jgi:hypothetical protein
MNTVPRMPCVRLYQEWHRVLRGRVMMCADSRWAQQVWLGSWHDPTGQQCGQLYSRPIVQYQTTFNTWSESEQHNGSPANGIPCKEGVARLCLMASAYGYRTVPVHRQPLPGTLARPGRYGTLGDRWQLAAAATCCYCRHAPSLDYYATVRQPLNNIINMALHHGSVARSLLPHSRR